MQTQWWYAALAAVAVAFGAGEAAAEGMRCGNRLVSKGDSTYEVRSRCGEPSDANRRVETRTERRRVRVPCGIIPQARFQLLRARRAAGKGGAGQCCKGGGEDCVANHLEKLHVNVMRRW